MNSNELFGSGCGKRIAVPALTTCSKASACCALIILAAANPSAAQILARSNFNIPPYTSGVSVDGQGGSEPGWAAPWKQLGGFSDRTHVVTSPTYEGNGAVQLFADQTFGSAFEREWSSIVPVVRIDAFVYVTPGAAMNGQIVTGTAGNGEIAPRRAGQWQIQGSGEIDVFDTTTNGFVSTGFHTLPNQWNEYSLIVNMNTNTYSFLFNNQLFNSPHPLAIMNPMFYVDGVNFGATGTLTTYVDYVTVTQVPEPPTFVLGALALFAACIAARRRKH